MLTVERARELPGLAMADSAYLADLAAAASAAVERYCKRTFALTTYTTERHDGEGEAALFVDDFPVTELEKVVMSEADGGEVEVSGDDIEVAQATGEIRFKPTAAYALFPRGFQNVAVTYTGGFTEIPEDVVEAAAQVAAWLHASAAHCDGVASEGIGDYKRSYEKAAAKDLPQAAKLLLAPYRNVRV